MPPLQLTGRLSFDSINDADVKCKTAMLQKNARSVQCATAEGSLDGALLALFPIAKFVHTGQTALLQKRRKVVAVVALVVLALCVTFRHLSGLVVQASLRHWLLDYCEPQSS